MTSEDLDLLLSGPWGTPQRPKHPGPIQRDALAAIMQAVIAGKKRVSTVLGVGLGLSSVAIECIKRLCEHRRVGRVLVVVDHKAFAQQFAHVCNDAGLRAALLERSIDPSIAANVQIATFAYLTSRSSKRLEELATDYYDMLVIPHLRANEALRKILERLVPPLAIGFSQSTEISLPVEFCPPVFIHELDSELKISLTNPPPGHRLVALGEISAIRQGLHSRRAESNQRLIDVAVVTGADIAREWKFPSHLERTIQVPDNQIDDQLWIRPGDILMPVIRSATTLHVGVIVPPDPPRAVPSHTVHLIRLNQPGIHPESILAFLESNLGRNALLAGSSFMAGDMRVSGLAEINVHVAVSEEVAGETTGDMTLANAGSRVRDEFLPRLKALLDSPTDEESREEQQRILANILRDVASSLARPSLSERVLTSFPTPIALAWRRFEDATFNPFEQVLRLRDLFEAACYFVYNVAFIDLIQRLDTGHRAQLRRHRTSWSDFAMAQRISFVEELLREVDDPLALFVPELATTNIPSLGLRLQREFRNKISHSNASTESSQRRLIENYRPLVCELIDELSFLEKYRMGRIPALHFRAGRPIQQIERWCGVVSNMGQCELDEDAEIPRIDRDHLVLLNIDNEHLDLHPMYRLFDDDDTRLQPQLFFLKSAKPRDGLLVFGSCHDATEREVEGHAAFKQRVDAFFQDPT